MYAIYLPRTRTHTKTKPQDVWGKNLAEQYSGIHISADPSRRRACGMPPKSSNQSPSQSINESTSQLIKPGLLDWSFQASILRAKDIIRDRTRPPQPATGRHRMPQPATGCQTSWPRNLRNPSKSIKSKKIYESMTKYKNPWKSMKIYENLFKSMENHKINENLWKSIGTDENKRKSVKSMQIYPKYMKIYFKSFKTN